MTIEQKDIPPHERGKAEIDNFQKYWFIKGTKDFKPIVCEFKNEAYSKANELNEKGGRCFVVGPFRKDEKGQYFHCGSEF